MNTAEVPPDLQLDEDLDFQRREWRASKILWIVVLAIMTATALGVFGSGALSSGERRTPDGALAIEYQRFTRFGASSRLSVSLATTPGSPVELSLSSAYLDAMSIVAIVPQPIAQEPADGGVRFRWTAAASRATRVHFDVQPVKRLLVRGVLGAPQHSIEFWQFVYP
jgi:hypothetical protein